MADTSLDRVLATLAKHDTELSGLKDAVGALVGKLDKVVQTLGEQRASQGPGVKEVMMICGMGGGLISMAAAAVTVLVLSIVQPAISELKTMQMATYKRIEKLEEERYQEQSQELRDYRRQRLRIPLEAPKS